MSNSFFNHTNRFVKLDTVRAEDVNAAFDGVSAGLDDVEALTNAALKLQPGETPAALPAAGTRANKVLTFDASGNPVATITTGDVTTVAGSIANVNTVGANIADVNTVAGNTANINTVAGIDANVTTVAGIAANVTTVAGDIAAVQTVAADLNEPVSEIETVAASIANVDSVGTNIANVNTVAANIADINTAATNMAAIIAAPTAASNAAASELIASTKAGEASNSAIAASNSALSAAEDADECAALVASISDGPVTSVNGKTGVVVLDAADIGVGVTVSGNLSPYVTQVTTLTITNYDSATTYTVSATGGTVSRTGDQIIYTAGGTAGTFAVTVNGRAVPITVQPASAVAPTITSPTNGATGITETPTFTTDAFQSIGQADTQLNADWELRTGPNGTGTLVASSMASTTNKTSWTLSAGLMVVSTTYYLRVLHRGNTLGASAWSEVSFTTAASFNSYIATPAPTPTNYGDAFEGGFYAGLYWDQIAQSSSSKTLATGTQTFTVPDMTATPIVYAGQTLEVRSRANPANKFIGTVTGATGASLTLNVTSIGGSGTFSDWSVMSRFRAIVAPKASGEHAGIALKNANTAFPSGCQSLVDGWTATEAMKNADTSTVYPAAHWARGLNIGGKMDWHIPARDVLELCWRNLKPTTTDNYVIADRSTGQAFDYKINGAVGDTANTHGTNNNSSPTGAAYMSSVPGQTAATAFRTGGAEAYEFGSAYYWSSTEYSATFAWHQFWNASNPGYQYSYSKSLTYRVRAVRRSII